MLILSDAVWQHSIAAFPRDLDIDSAIDGYVSDCNQMGSIRIRKPHLVWMKVLLPFVDLYCQVHSSGYNWRWELARCFFTNRSKFQHDQLFNQRKHVVNKPHHAQVIQLQKWSVIPWHNAQKRKTDVSILFDKNSANSFLLSVDVWYKLKISSALAH